MQGLQGAEPLNSGESARGASSGADSAGKGSVASDGGKGSVRMVGRGRSPNSESSTPSLMPSGTVVVNQAWSSEESSEEEDGYLFGDEKRRSYMKRWRASRASGERAVAAGPSGEGPQGRRGASLLESLSEGVASIWPRDQTPPSRDSIQSTVLVTQDGEEKLVEEECQVEDPQEGRGLFAAAELAQSLKRLSFDLSAGVLSMADALRVAQPQEARWTGARDHDSLHSHPVSPNGRLNMENLMNEAHLPFRQLLQEVPDPEHAPGGILASFPRLQRLQGTKELSREGLNDAARAASSLPVQSPLFSAVVRARLAAHLVGCYECTTAELSGEELQLWDVFVHIDHSLSGSLRLGSDIAGELCNGLAEVSTRQQAEACVNNLFERVDESCECDFADLLDVWESEKAEQPWLRYSIRAGWSNLLVGAGFSAPAPSRVPELRARSARLSDLDLAVAAAAYQRTLVLTCSWHCEQQLNKFLSSKDNNSSSNVKVLLAVLRGIHNELVPTERVLWELMGQEKNFDGSATKEEVLAALEELLGFHEEDSRASPNELEELDCLRRQCQRRSLENLFAKGRQVVAFADVLRWWWDMPEEYREAAGLTVPASVLRQRLRRQPEEMFRGPLRRAAAEPAYARQALRGHVRAFAELRALAVRRTIEGLSIRSTAESRTSTSEAGDASILSVDAELEDEVHSPGSTRGT